MNIDTESGPERAFTPGSIMIGAAVSLVFGLASGPSPSAAE